MCDPLEWASDVPYTLFYPAIEDSYWPFLTLFPVTEPRNTLAPHFPLTGRWVTHERALDQGVRGSHNTSSYVVVVPRTCKNNKTGVLAEIYILVRSPTLMYQPS